MTSVFQGKGMLISGILHLSPREAHEALKDGAVLVDVSSEPT